MIRLASKLSRKLSEHAVLRYIAANPGKQLYQINAATLNSHHSWGTKSVLSELERHGKIDVVRFRVVRIKGRVPRKKISLCTSWQT